MMECAWPDDVFVLEDYTSDLLVTCGRTYATELLVLTATLASGALASSLYHHQRYRGAAKVGRQESFNERDETNINNNNNISTSRRNESEDSLLEMVSMWELQEQERNGELVSSVLLFPIVRLLNNVLLLSQQEQQDQSSLSTHSSTTTTTTTNTTATTTPRMRTRSNHFATRALSWSSSATTVSQDENNNNNKNNATESWALLSSFSYSLSDGSVFLPPPLTAGRNESSRLSCDVHVHILSFLHPRDVVQFACCNRASYQLVHATNNTNNTAADKNDTAAVRLWKTLWMRDYGWMIYAWSIGQDAYQRSMRQLQDHHQQRQQHQPGGILFSKDFYFAFAWSWCNYLLAGHNKCNSTCATTTTTTTTGNAVENASTWSGTNNGGRCLVGIGGHVYDLTSFVRYHPGSPETVLIHAGRDATEIFQRIGHSKTARQFAQDSLCIIVDLSTMRSNTTTTTAATATCDTSPSVCCGTRPTAVLHRQVNNNNNQNATFIADNNMEWTLPPEVKPPSTFARVSPRRRRATTLTRQEQCPHRDQNQQQQQQQQQRRSCGTVRCVRDALIRQERQARIRAARQLAHKGVVGDIAVYYDPFCQNWKAWYTNANLENVFVEQI